MGTETEIPPDAVTDGQLLLDSLLCRRPLDSETYRRVRERAERITEKLRQSYGQMDIAIDLIREIRDEE